MKPIQYRRHLAPRAGVVVPHQTENQQLSTLRRDVTRQRVGVRERARFAPKVVRRRRLAHPPFERAVNARDDQRFAPDVEMLMREHEFEQS